MEQVLNNEQIGAQQMDAVGVAQGVDVKGLLAGVGIGAAAVAATFVASKAIMKKVKAKAQARKGEPIDVDFKEVNVEDETEETKTEE